MTNQPIREALADAFDHATKAKVYGQKGKAGDAGFHATKVIYAIQSAQNALSTALAERDERIAELDEECRITMVEIENLRQEIAKLKESERG